MFMLDELVISRVFKTCDKMQKQIGDSPSKLTMATTRSITESTHYSSRLETSGGYTRTETFASSSGSLSALPALNYRKNLNFDRGTDIRRSAPLMSNTQNQLYISPFQNRHHNASNPSIPSSNPGGSLRQHRSAMNGEPKGTYPKKNVSKQNANESKKPELQKKSKSFFPIFSKSNNKKDAKKENKTGTTIDAKLTSPINSSNNIPEDMNRGIVIKVRKTGKMLPLENDSVPTYETKSKYRRGKVLLINNINFEKPRYRHGADIDHKNIQNLFKGMGFTVTDHKNKSKKDMEKVINEYCNSSSLKDADINITIIMSHGNGTNNTYIETIDKKALELEWIVEQFSNRNCSYLANKPKIFIFQCCRGDATDVQTDAIPFQTPRNSADVLLAYATVPGFVSYRDQKYGTWYIQSICKIFMEDACEIDVENLLKKVDQNMQKNSYFHRQTSSYENRGFKRCYLNPI